MSQATYGEMRVKELLQRLPYDEFSCYAEPRVDSAVKGSRYPDFMIIWRKRGILVLEVKDFIEIKGGDQRQIKIVPRIGEEKVVKNPVETARDYGYHLKELLEKRRELLVDYLGEEKLQFPIEYALVLPNQSRSTLSWLESSNLFPQDKVFSQDDLFSNDTFMNRLCQLRWTFTPKHEMTDATISVITHTIKAVEVRSRPDEQANHVGEKHGTLTLHQESLVYRPLPVQDGGLTAFVVRGTVGSGKTIVLTKRAELLGELRSDLKVLVTAFNLDLSADLRLRIPSRHIEVMPFYDVCEKVLGDEYPRHSVYRDKFGPGKVGDWLNDKEWLLEGCTFDKYFMALEIARRKEMKLERHVDYKSDLKSRGEQLTDSEIETVNAAYEWYLEHQEQLKTSGQGWQDWEDIAPMTMEALLRNHKMRRYYDVIMIDEAQDFAPDWFKIFKLLLKPGGHLMMMDDPMQSLWRTFDWAERGFPNVTPELLLLPMRTTRSIADFAQSLFEIVEEMRTTDDERIYPMRTDHLEQGELSTLTEYIARDLEVIAVREAIDRKLASGCAPKQIAVLTPNNSKVWEAYCQEKNIYWANFNRTKGMEFECVFIPELDTMFSDAKSNHAVAKRATYRKLFVALTRARQTLHVSFTGMLPDALDPLRYYSNYSRIDT